MLAGVALAELALPALAVAAPSVSGRASLASSVRSGPLSLSATSLLQNRAAKSAGLSPIRLDVSRFSFTLPNQAPVPVDGKKTERSFVFTPSGKAGKGVSVAVSAEHNASTRLSSAPVELVAPSGQSYNIDMAVAYGRFAVNGGVHQTRPEGGPLAAGLLDERQMSGVDFGVSYGTHKWRTSLQARANTSSLTRVTPQQRSGDRYAVEAGGALVLSPRLSVGGGVRYRLAPDYPTPVDPDKDDRAVFVGGRLAF